MLSLRPIWLGFAFNTIFYVVILRFIMLGPFTARRHLRRKRGHLRFKRGNCTECGYDLRGDYAAGCPECGWRREDVP